MKASRSAAWLLVLALATSCAPLAPGRGAALDDAMSAFVVFTPAQIEAGTSLRGAAVDVIEVRGGEVVRLELREAHTLELAERTSAAGRATESWLRVKSRNRLAWVRPAAFTRALLVPRGAVVRAQLGHSSDPGYHWFELEDRVLAWAAGPLPGSFPPLAPRQRIDVAAFAEIDRALLAAVTPAGDRASALAAARAIRKVVGLRALRALRPASGFPYFYDERLEPSAGVAQYDAAGRVSYEVGPARPLELRVQGPALLHLFAQAQISAADTGTAELRVFEGNRLRALTGASLPRAPLTSTDPAMLDASIRPLRRAIVHVPPGEHVYEIEATTPALVAPLRSQAVVHLEDATAKDEAVALELARHACRRPAVPALCAMALALLGEDRDGVQPRSGELTWRAAIDASAEPVRRISETLASGGPRDPALALELAASNGDSAALSQLAALIGSSVDDGTRAAWVHAMWRGTTWALAPTETGGENWASLARGAPGASDTCRTSDSAAWPEVTTTDAEFAATIWHGVATLELMVSASCDDPTPIELVVDGQRLTANPAAGRVRWHVRVRAAVAHVRRLDAGRAHVYAIAASPEQHAECAARWSAIHAPRPAAAGLTLEFGPKAEAPGLDVWLRDGANLADVRVSALAATQREAPALHIVTARAPGPTALDETGTRFTRVARVALPAWAASGVRVQATTADVALRALVRVPRAQSAPTPPGVDGAAPPPAPLDEGALVELSRRILDASGLARARLHLERAQLLARGGAAAAALADARAADALGGREPAGASAVEQVLRAIRRRALDHEPLPAGVGAYGIEPDFDRGTRRCVRSSDGPRAQLERVLAQLQLAAAQPASRAYDAALAARAVEAGAQNPLDPRAPGLVARALTDSRWRQKRDVGRPEQRVWREPTQRHEGPVDGQGELRARVALGARFDAGTFASVSSDKPAVAVLAGLAPGAVVRVDLACAALEPAQAGDARCPIEVQLGSEAAQQPLLGQSGVGTVLFTIAHARPESLSIHVASSAARWVAHARIALDRKVQDSVEVPGVGWVLTPKHLERRIALAAGQQLAIDAPTAGLYRIDARGEAESPAELIVHANGRDRMLPLDGSPVVVALPEPSRLVLESRGAVSIAVAERVPREASDATEQEISASAAPPESTAPPQRSVSSAGTLDPNGPSPAPPPTWLALAEASPPPLTPLEASLGTAVAATGAVYGTLRQGSRPSTAPDGFVFAIAGYRRRVESIGLWTDVELFGRARDGEPTYGANATLYEEIEALHLRLSTSLGIEAQQVAGIPARTWLSRGFAEYSWRATRDFFLLPRIGYDGVYMSLRSRPSSLAYVDDEVYNAYRAPRPTFLYAQALLWYTPYFNQIVYLRIRGSYDPRAGIFSHGSLRPGAFVAFGDLDLSAFVDSVWYPPADSFSGRTRFNENAGVVARYDFWSNLGSLDVQPGVAAFSHITGGGWQVNVFVNLLASYRRGLRDFSSLELDFPEQLGGGIPWRGTNPGGYR